MTPKVSDKDLTIRVGNNIRKHRKLASGGAAKGKKITLKEIARYFDVTQAAVSNWENGRGECSYYVLSELSKMFSCSIDDFFKEERQKTEKRDSIFEGKETEVVLAIPEGGS
jgi:transcriptional regulator with XRE-family HTH domain